MPKPKATPPATQAPTDEASAGCTVREHKLALDFFDGINFTIKPGSDINTMFNGIGCVNEFVEAVLTLQSVGGEYVTERCQASLSLAVKFLTTFNTTMVDALHSEFLEAQR